MHQRNVLRVVLLVDFVELQTDKQFQMKMGGISAALLGGAVLAGRGHTYRIITSESTKDVILCHSLVMRLNF